MQNKRKKGKERMKKTVSDLGAGALFTNAWV
jgi:hypothetical protein